MNTNQAWKIMENEYGMEEIQALWKDLEKEGWNFLEFRKLMRQMASKFLEVCESAEGI